MHPRTAPGQATDKTAITYSTFTPGISLAEYSEKLGQPLGTSKTDPCGETLGSFLACYLQHHLTVHQYNPDFLENESASINALLAKGCKINFNASKQLPEFFDALVNHLPLYIMLINKKYLTPELQCENGETFLHRYFNKVTFSSEVDIQAATDLVLQCQSALTVKSEHKYPLSVLLEKIKTTLSTCSEETKTSLLPLLEACQPKEANHTHTQDESLIFLNACFTLVAMEKRADKLIGFQAAIIAAHYGMPLHQGLKHHFNNKSLLALFMETDTEFQWGIPLMRAITKASLPASTNVTVQTNAADIEFKRADALFPEEASSYLLFTNFSKSQKAAYKEHRVNPNFENDNLTVFRLDKAADILSVSHIIEGWKAATSENYNYLFRNYAYTSPTGSEYELGDITGPYYIRIHLRSVNKKYLGESNKYSKTILELPNWHSTGFLNMGPYSSFHTTLNKVNSEYVFFVNSEEMNPYAYPHSRSWTPMIHLLAGTYNRLQDGEHHLEYHEIVTPGNLKALREKLITEFVPAITSLENRVPLSSYYHLYTPLKKPSIYKNSLLAYLEKGGSVCEKSIEALHPCEFYEFERQFKLRQYIPERFIQTAPHETKPSAIFHHALSGECIGFSQKPDGDEFVPARVYDFVVLKMFKSLGYDFSVPEVTQFIEKLIQQEELSPPLYHLLQCLNECGAVFPEKIAGLSYHDAMTKRLAASSDKSKLDRCNFFLIALADHANESALNLKQCQDYLASFGMPALQEPLLTYLESEEAAKIYLLQLEKNLLTSNRPFYNYPQKLTQLTETLHWAEIEESTHAFGSGTDLIAALKAYLISEDYKRNLTQGNDYYDFFSEAIRIKLYLLHTKLEAAYSHQSHQKNKVSNFFGNTKRKMAVGSLYNEIIGQIMLITQTSPSDQKEKIEILTAFIAFEKFVKQEAASPHGSQRFDQCLKEYVAEIWFKDKMMLPLTLRQALGHIIPEALRVRFKEFVNDDAHRVIAGSQPPSAPDDDNAEYNPKTAATMVSTNDNNETSLYPSVTEYDPTKIVPQQPMPSAPPSDHPDVVDTARPLYPTLITNNSGIFDAYKQTIDLLYSAYPDMATMIDYLNENIESIRDNVALPRPIQMMICQDTGKLSKYPCMIDGDSTKYYDLDHCIAKNIDASRITLRQLSEITLGIYIMEATKSQLEFEFNPPFRVNSAY